MQYEILSRLLYYRIILKIRIFYLGKIFNRLNCSGLEMSERLVVGFLFYLIIFDLKSKKKR